LFVIELAEDGEEDEDGPWPGGGRLDEGCRRGRSLVYPFPCFTAREEEEAGLKSREVETGEEGVVGVCGCGGRCGACCCADDGGGEER